MSTNRPNLTGRIKNRTTSLETPMTAKRFIETLMIAALAGMAAADIVMCAGLAAGQDPLDVVSAVYLMLGFGCLSLLLLIPLAHVQQAKPANATA